VTYIAGIRANAAGVVISADSQETIGSDREYVEKLVCSDRVVVAGAGRGELVDGFCQHALEAFEDYASLGDRHEADSLIRSALKGFYANDVKLLPGKGKQVQFLIAASLEDGTVGLWNTKGIRTFPVESYYAIGIESIFVRHLARTLYPKDREIALSHAILLATLFVNAAKRTSEAVGGNTALTVITRHGVERKDKAYISDVEERLGKLDDVLSDIRVAVSDLSLTGEEFKEMLERFQVRAEKIRDDYSQRMINDLILRGIGAKDSNQELPIGRVAKTGQIVTKYKELGDEQWGLSQSISASPSHSPSASASPSVSPSVSPSASVSPSHSHSASPSFGPEEDGEVE
jgi:20S proteasome alpha/beta subunit